MGFLDSLKEKALEASEAVKEKTTSAKLLWIQL